MICYWNVKGNPKSPGWIFSQLESDCHFRSTGELFDDFTTLKKATKQLYKSCLKNSNNTTILNIEIKPKSPIQK